MRVIGGKLRGKLIHIPIDKTTRPLKDMVRESIFNILCFVLVSKYLTKEDPMKPKPPVTMILIIYLFYKTLY